MFTVYKISFAGSKKVYIGYTSKTISKRLSDHVKNATTYESDVHISRAIRKYGVINIAVEKLVETADRKTAQEKEKFFIEQYDSYANGYNMTKGGDGGWCVPDEKYRSWKKTCSKPLDKNGRWSGYSDEEIASLYKEDYELNPYGWSFHKATTRICEKYNKFPKMLSKCRFLGFEGKTGKDRLVDFLHKKYLISKEDLKYKPTKEHISNNSSIIKSGSRWYYNEDLKISKQSDCDLSLDEGWKRGRKLKWH